MLIRKRHVSPGAAGSHVEAWPWPIKVRILGRFTLGKDGKPVSFTGKTPKRPLELLKALIALGGRSVSRARLVESLWPDADGDVSAASFNLARKWGMNGESRHPFRESPDRDILGDFCQYDVSDWSSNRSGQRRLHPPISFFCPAIHLL